MQREKRTKDFDMTFDLSKVATSFPKYLRKYQLFENLYNNNLYFQELLRTCGPYSE